MKSEFNMEDAKNPVSTGTLKAIFQTTEDNYVPVYIKERARMGPTMFTGEFQVEDRSKIETDQKIKTYSLAKKI